MAVAILYLLLLAEETPADRVERYVLGSEPNFSSHRSVAFTIRGLLYDGAPMAALVRPAGLIPGSHEAQRGGVRSWPPEPASRPWWPTSGAEPLTDPEVSPLLETVVSAVAHTLDVGYTAVFELLAGGDELLLGAGAGWEYGVGHTTVGAGRRSVAGYTLASESPVVAANLRGEPLRVPPLLADHGVVSAVTVLEAISRARVEAELVTLARQQTALAELVTLARQQAALAELGRLALRDSQLTSVRWGPPCCSASPVRWSAYCSWETMPRRTA